MKGLIARSISLSEVLISLIAAFDLIVDWADDAVNCRNVAGGTHAALSGATVPSGERRQPEDRDGSVYVRKIKTANPSCFHNSA